MWQVELLRHLNISGVCETYVMLQDTESGGNAMKYDTFSKQKNTGGNQHLKVKRGLSSKKNYDDEHPVQPRTEKK